MKAEKIARVLPSFRGVKEIIKEEQSTKDIMNELLKAHSLFSKDYNLLIDYFNISNPVQLANQVFNFCKKNIKYKIEGDIQSTRSPAGMLYLANGDCKHYAGFVAGVLDAARRITKKNYEIIYRFVSYELFETVPAHVFIVMRYEGKEYWIDPVLQTFDQRHPKPTFTIDKIIPMPLVRISGTRKNVNRRVGFTINPNIITQATTAVNSYQAKAGSLSSTLNLAVSNIPFVGLAQGLLTGFFGQGGISDWLSPSGILNELKYIFTGRAFRGGQYWLGEKFRYYILGEDIHTKDADVVGDEAVKTAITVFSVGLGVPIEDYQDILNLRAGRDAYISRYVSLGANILDINAGAVDRAVQLLRQYFPGEREGNTNTKGVVPQKWNPNDFNKIPFVVPIPDFTKPYSQMWLGTYTGLIPDGEVKEGIVIAGNLKTATTNLPAATGTGKIDTKTWLIIGAVALGAGYFLLRKKR